MDRRNGVARPADLACHRAQCGTRRTSRNTSDHSDHKKAPSHRSSLALRVPGDKPIVNGLLPSASTRAPSARWTRTSVTIPCSRRLRLRVRQLDGVSDQMEDVAEREAHARLIRICEYVEATLKAADPELIPFGVLNQLAT